MSAYACAVLGAVLGLGGAALAIVSRYLPRPRTASVPGVVRTGYRYCPACHGTRAAYVHADGSATCADDQCGTHIPAGDS